MANQLLRAKFIMLVCVTRTKNESINELLNNYQVTTNHSGYLLQLEHLRSRDILAGK